MMAVMAAIPSHTHGVNGSMNSCTRDSAWGHGPIRAEHCYHQPITAHLGTPVHEGVRVKVDSGGEVNHLFPLLQPVVSKLNAN